MRAAPAVLLALALAAPALAQEPLRPAELPPEGYAGQQYVDSRGCLFMRAGPPGQAFWLPRVTRQGVPLCGNPPSGKPVPVAGEEAAATSVGAGQEYFVAVGSFSLAGNAARALKRVRALDYPATSSQLEAGLETVFAGPFSTSAIAEQARDALLGRGFREAVVVAGNP